MSTTRKRASAQNADKALFKQVLLQIESSPFGRKHINGLDTICFKGEYASFYPEDKRGPLRVKWDNLRRQTVHNYIRSLQEYDIEPGAATLKELRLANASKSPSTDKDGQESDDSKEDDTVLSDLFGSIDLSDSHPKQGGSLPFAPPQTASTVPSTTFGHTPPQWSSPSFPTMDTPSHHESAIEGTRAKPFKFVVNPNFLEKNMARFKITQTPGKDHNGVKHTVWEVHVTIPHLDYGKWEAFFKPPNKILVKGPSRSFFEKLLWNAANHDYNDPSARPEHDQARQDAHQTLENDIENDDDREYNWWQAEIPGVVLDNTVLSGQGTLQIEKEIIKLMDTDTGIKGCVVGWVIAEAGGIITKKKEHKIRDIDSLLNL